MLQHVSHPSKLSLPIECLTMIRPDLGSRHPPEHIPLYCPGTPGNARFPDIDTLVFPVPPEIAIEQCRPEDVIAEPPAESLSIPKPSPSDLIVPWGTNHPQPSTRVVNHNDSPLEWKNGTHDISNYLKYRTQEVWRSFVANFGFSFGDLFDSFYLTVQFEDIVVQGSLAPWCGDTVNC